MINWHSFAWAILAIFLTVGIANACVEPLSTNTGNYARNGCPYTVNLTWCFGENCTPKAGGTKVGRGKFLLISRNNTPFQISYCRYPSRIVRKDNGYTCNN